jgi:hypothetical protein
MSNLLFLLRSCEYRHAAVAVFRRARAMPIGSERNMARVLARGLRDLARTEAWLEGQSFYARRFRHANPDCTTVSPVLEPEMSDRRSGTTQEQA